MWTAGEPSPLPAATAQGSLPTTFALHAARPNPFGGATTLGYDLPSSSQVRLVVYDVLGREVALLLDEEQPAGRHEAVLDGSRLPSGAYLVRLEAGGVVRTQRVTLVR